MDRLEQPCGSNSLQISPPSVQLPGRRSLHVASSPQRPQRRPSRLKRPAQARAAPRPWSSRSALGPAPTALLPRCSLPGGERCPRGGGVGWAHRSRRPRSSPAGWEGAWFTKSGEAPRCLRRTPVGQGQPGGTAARQPWYLPAPSEGSAAWGVMCSGPAERKT